jgi:hypothetical protein
VIENPISNPAGFAVADSASAKEMLQEALTTSSTLSGVIQSKLCVIINDRIRAVTLAAQKTSAGWDVRETTGYCSGVMGEDIIVQFSDYDSFSKLVNDPTPRAIALAAKTRGFEVLPSKYIENGGNVLCDAGFKTKYCGALKSMAGNSDLIEGDMVCCLDTLSKADKQLLETHLEDQRYKDELGLVEKPTGGIDITMIGIGAIISVIVIIIFIVLVFRKKTPAPEIPSVSHNYMPMQPIVQAPVNRGNPELENYAGQALSMGYSAEELRNYLISIGWDAQTVDESMRSAMQKMQG